MPIKIKRIKPAQISIRRFSCLDTADLSLSQITVLIGPQGSGKSVISKLVFFCFDVLNKQFSSIEDGKTFDEFKLELAEEFNRWFPPTAWGRHPFIIKFQAGPYSIAIRRANQRNNKLAEKVRIGFSKFFEKEYKISARTDLLP